jgi:16S rRNA (guanine1516-N2)-methyltransferase
MHAFQRWIGDDLDSASLLAWAQQNALQRVVVKRPKQSVFLDNRLPAYQYIGKNTRFDVYLPIQTGI